MESTVTYFEEPGRKNTLTTLEIAKKRALELGIKKVLVASSHGYTALEAAKVFEGTGIEVIAISISNSFQELGWSMTPEERSKLEKVGINVLTGLHGLADGVAEGFLGEHTPGSIIADTLRMFSQGTKVAVEISIMAVEAGLIQPGSEIISIAGTSEGCDTALVVRPSFARKIKDFRICEILCKPRIA
ncbi:hypothetical protein KVG29_03465 [Caldicoprobacter algeriensis]|uniref:pyruvate kinase alpha/beta domain-containing protein n=1 Tax=Caldicoprobacter algeriensis TaxID=699281 RepID=UPI002079C86F|nr:pyruvate kinase alpha/beta domain-containing protein [Caldicoprobacter algeriensis]MCM8900283.1 hypothetical protein [Caldicoprobacter algeriensis]